MLIETYRTVLVSYGRYETEIWLTNARPQDINSVKAHEVLLEPGTIFAPTSLPTSIDTTITTNPDKMTYFTPATKTHISNNAANLNPGASVAFYKILALVIAVMMSSVFILSFS